MRSTDAYLRPPLQSTFAPRSCAPSAPVPAYPRHPSPAQKTAPAPMGARAVRRLERGCLVQDDAAPALALFDHAGVGAVRFGDIIPHREAGNALAVFARILEVPRRLLVGLAQPHPSEGGVVAFADGGCQVDGRTVDHLQAREIVDRLDLFQASSGVLGAEDRAFKA